MIVRKPDDPGQFNGTVILEWLNVSAGADGDPGFMYVSQEILRTGYAWVGVSAQKIGVEGGRFSMMPGIHALKKFDTERYGSLSHPGDDYCYDIFTQAARIVKGAGTLDVLAGLQPRRLIAYGESQSAMRMVSYINGVHPLVQEFDGFFVHSRGAMSLPFTQEFVGQAVQIRDDMAAKVFEFQTEGDVLGKRGYFLARQPNSDNHHCWEVAGTAHADQYILDFNMKNPEAKSFWNSMGGVKFNNGPQHLVIKAALAALNQWLIDDTTPPEAEPLVVNADGSAVTDEHGNILGGVRTPAVDVPVSTLKPRPEPGSSGAANVMSGLFGQTIPFTSEKRLQLYPTHADYVTKVKASAAKTRQAGFILEPEEQWIVSEAEAAPIPIDIESEQAMDTVVMTDAGPIQGCLEEQEGVKVFKGIPFAAPPVGQNRWREPQPVEPWSQIRDCTEFGPACPQSDILVRTYGIKAPVLDEDCLYLNVFTPAKTTNDKLPVMVWFYGGGFGVGDASTYDMSRFSQLGAVVVTINYRVGVMGFLAHESLSQESPHHVSGNYGLLDMVASLRWVQRNIAQFGGSPDNVTIFGQSAGASGVCYLMASPQTKGLFHKAISQSHGAYSLDPTLKMQEETGALFFKALGCDRADDPLAAARAKSWQEVFELSQVLGSDGQVLPAESRKPRIRFWPNIDGWLNADASFLVFAKGQQANVPLLIGSNQDESDRTFTAGTRYFAQQHSRLNPQVYRYFFTQPSKSPFFLGKAAHAAEIAYFMRGNPVVANHFDDQDWALSDVISQAWVQFARIGNPNIEGKPFTWPQYDAEIDSYLELGLEIKPGIGIRSSICDQIDDEIRRAVVSRSAGH